MNKPIIILVAGGTASGKSTVVEQIQSGFLPHEVSVVCMDNYYKRRDDLPFEERMKINYDHPDAIDMDLLKEHIYSLVNNEAIECPLYDFSKHNRSNNVIEIFPSKVIIVEGILALFDSSIRSYADIQIFVESDADIRFIRRLKRDMEERGRSLDNVIEQYLSTVKPMYDLYVEPTKRYADIIIPNHTKHDIAIDILTAKIKDIVK